ncbi:ABC transporter substrate-binding protein [Oerskovia sp. M15]
MDAVGLENIAASVQDTWTPFSFEEIIAADPDVIVLVDSAWNTAQSKIDALTANPATANLTAVRTGRFLTVPFPRPRPASATSTPSRTSARSSPR